MPVGGQDSQRVAAQAPPTSPPHPPTSASPCRSSRLHPTACVEPIRTLHLAPAVMPSILALDRIRAGFGEATVLNGISVRLAEGGSLSLPDR
jgi:hypothetical protein